MPPCVQSQVSKTARSGALSRDEPRGLLLRGGTLRPWKVQLFLFLSLGQGFKKLFRQKADLFGVFFLNEGLSEVLPYFPRVSRHGCFLLVISGAAADQEGAGPLQKAPAPWLMRLLPGSADRLRSKPISSSI